MSKRNRMPGLRQKGGLWHIEKRCRYAAGGWLRESTGTSSRAEAEQVLIHRLAELEQQAIRKDAAIFTFQEAGLRYLEEIAEKSSAGNIAMHLDQLFFHHRHSANCPRWSAGVPLETRKALLGRANGDITTHYSAAELNELKKAAEKIVDQRVAQTPTLTLLRVTRAAVGKVSEKERVGECYSLTLCFTGAPRRDSNSRPPGS